MNRLTSHDPKINIFVLFVAVIFGQTTITTSDLQYEIGGFYKMYNIPSPQGVIGMTGIQGGPHTFDFSEGTTADSLIICYIPLYSYL